MGKIRYQVQTKPRIVVDKEVTSQISNQILGQDGPVAKAYFELVSPFVNQILDNLENCLCEPGRLQ